MSKTIEIVRRIVGRRHKISAEDMIAILDALHREVGLDLRNSYVASTLDLSSPYDQESGHAQSPTAACAWARMCRDITCISVDARGGLRDGYVRYDQPGSMNPMQRAEILFAPSALEGREYDQIDQLRRHADRVLVVSPLP